MSGAVHIRKISFLLTLAAVAACGAGKGSVQGDVYFSGPRGEPVRAAGVAVLLLHGGDSAAAAIDRLCAQDMRESIRLKLALSQAMTGGMSHVGELGSDADLASFARYAPIVNATKDSIQTLSRETLKRLRSIESGAISDSVVTHIDAHFRFTDIPVGRYIALARGVYGGEFRGWMAPVEIKAKRDTVVDLGPSEDQTTRLSCGIIPSDLEGAQPSDVAAASQAGKTLEAHKEAARAAAAAERRFDDSVHKAALAEIQLNERMPWIADRTGLKTYYNVNCPEAPGIPKEHQVRFKTQAEAEAAGYRHSAIRGC